MQIPLTNEHLFCKYFVRLFVGNATKGFATYGCFHPCFFNARSNFFSSHFSFESLFLGVVKMAISLESAPWEGVVEGAEAAQGMFIQFKFGFFLA